MDSYVLWPPLRLPLRCLLNNLPPRCQFRFQPPEVRVGPAAEAPLPKSSRFPLRRPTTLPKAGSASSRRRSSPTLRKLGAIFVPPSNGSVGALDTDAPEFLDFLIGASPAERQTLYRSGLDGLNAQARRQFNKAFADLDNKQADTILKPLLTAVPWVYDLPKDPMKRFVYQVHQDLRTATRNSPAAAAASANSGRRGGAGGGLYWNPIDPV